MYDITEYFGSGASILFNPVPETKKEYQRKPKNQTGRHPQNLVLFSTFGERSHFQSANL